MSSAAEKAPSLEEMWAIIQQQQETIEALKVQLAEQDQKVQQDVQQVEAQVEAQQEAITVVADAV